MMKGCTETAKTSGYVRDSSNIASNWSISISDAFRLMMVKIAKEKALPFEPLVPNEETIEAMKAARRGKLTTAGPPGNYRKPDDASLELVRLGSDSELGL